MKGLSRESGVLPGVAPMEDTPPSQVVSLYPRVGINKRLPTFHPIRFARTVPVGYGLRAFLFIELVNMPITIRNKLTRGCLMGFWRRTEPKKEVVTDEDMAAGLSLSTLEAAKNLMENLKEQGVTATLTHDQCLLLMIEVLVLEIACMCTSIINMFGKRGHKVCDIMTDLALESFAENLHVNDIPKFVKAGQ